MTWLVTSFILAKYAQHLSPIVPDTNFSREFFICGGQIIFQGIVVLAINRKRYFDYIGNMMTISFVGSMLLTIPLALQSISGDPIVFAAWFILVVSLMFLEHIRRTRLLKISWVMTFSWVVYRIIVLATIL